MRFGCADSNLVLEFGERYGKSKLGNLSTLEESILKAIIMGILTTIKTTPTRNKGLGMPY